MSYFGDRAKENWVKLGDCNTKYFHQNANRRQKRNWLHSLVDDGWVWHENRKEMEDVVVSYFSTLFTSNGAANFEDILCNITLSVTEEMNNHLGRPITDKECQSSKCIPPKHLNPMVCLPGFIKSTGGL